MPLLGFIITIVRFVIAIVLFVIPIVPLSYCTYLLLRQRWSGYCRIWERFYGMAGTPGRPREQFHAQRHTIGRVIVRAMWYYICVSPEPHTYTRIKRLGHYLAPANTARTRSRSLGWVFLDLYFWVEYCLTYIAYSLQYFGYCVQTVLWHKVRYAM